MDYKKAASVLRAKAAKTEFPDEAAALIAKAEELERKYGKQDEELPPSARPYKVNVQDVDDFFRAFYGNRKPADMDYELFLFSKYSRNTRYGRDTTEYDESADQWDRDADDWYSGAEL